MSGISASLSKWFSERPQWLQIAATRLLQQPEFTDKDVSELATLCQQEADGKLPKTTCSFPATAFSQGAAGTLRLCSISDVEGVNALAPKKPLEFGKGNITIVYGNNGSGKSGYVRLLKHVCGARETGTLHRNVYKPDSAVQKACISFEQDGIPKSHTWSGQGICDDLNSVDIFDTSFGKVFVSSEDEVSYEPPVLSFFSSLILACEKVASALDAEANRHQSKKPNIPADKKVTPEGVWYEAISAKTTTQDIDKHCTFSSVDETEMQALQQRLAEQAPAEKAKQLRKQKQYIDTLVQDTQKYLEQLSDENYRRIIAAKKKSILKKTAADTAADVSAGRFYTGASYGTNWFTAPITVGGNTFNWAIYGDTVIAGGATFGTRVRFTEGASLSIRDTPIFAKEIEMWDAKELHLEVPSNRISSIGFSYWQTKPGNQIHCWTTSVFAHYDTSLVLDKSTTFHLHGYDQNLSNLRINDAGSCVTSDVPAQLYAVQRDYNAVFKGTFQGAVDYAKSGGHTVTLAGTNTSQGSLSVVNGQLTIAPEGCWAGTNVVVGSDVSSITPTLRLQGSQSFTDPKNTVITMITAPNGTPPRIQLEEGVDQTVGWLWLDGARLGMGTWGSTSSAATHQDDTHFAGTGILTVRGDGGGTLITIR